MSQLTIKLSAKADALIAQLQKEIFNRRRKKVSPAGVVETLVESGAKSQSDKRFATSWTNLIADIEKAAKVANAHGSKPANLTDAEWAMILSHRSRTASAPATPARRSSRGSSAPRPAASATGAKSARSKATKVSTPKVSATKAASTKVKPAKPASTGRSAKASPSARADQPAAARPAAAAKSAAKVKPAVGARNPIRKVAVKASASKDSAPKSSTPKTATSKATGARASRTSTGAARPAARRKAASSKAASSSSSVARRMAKAVSRLNASGAAPLAAPSVNGSAALVALG